VAQVQVKGEIMAQVKSGDTVKIHYTGKLGSGVVFDTSIEREPLEFTTGQGQVIPGFENAVMGMEIGQSKTFTVPFNEAYGPHNPELVMAVEKAKMPDDLNPHIGQHLQARQDDGRVINFIVSNVTENEVTLDGNHPLAGQDLTFDIELVAVS
jgi:FKBP-type peptidyl-prolyl cis-trans isomerase 2